MKLISNPWAARDIPWIINVIYDKTTGIVLVTLVDHFRALQASPVINAIR